MKKQVIKLTESDLHRIIKESVNRVIKEDYSVEQYTHFAVNKQTKLIVNGWDYSGYGSNELKLFKKDYFDVDLIDKDFNPREYYIWSRKHCLKNGIDPNDMSNWSNDGITPLN